MKNIILFFILFLSLYQGTFATDLIYSKISNNSHLYLKSDLDNLDGTEITSVQSYYPKYSSDGLYIYYQNHSDLFLYKKSSSDSSNGSVVFTGFTISYFDISPDDLSIIYVNNGKLYKKSSSDSFTGSQISTSTGVDSPVYSPDGLSIVYANGSDGNKLYKKSSSDASNGIAITTVSSRFAVYSPDGLSIVYANGSDGDKLYKKSSSDASNGTAITTVSTYWNSAYSTDGLSIVYTNGTDFKLYKKSSSDASNGTAITIGTATFPDYKSLIPIAETCTDGIKNQDETGIDFGGICNCYQSSVASRSFVPFNYVNGFLQYSPFSVPFINETLNFVNTGTTWIEQNFKYSIHVNQHSDSGSLLNVMSTMSLSPSGYAVHYTGDTEIEVTLYPDAGTDWTTTSNATLGSNAINHVHIFTNVPWELYYYGINDVSTASGVVNNVEDDYESVAFPDVFGDVDLTPLNTDADRKTRRFRIKFLSPNSPTITSIQWGDTNKTLTTVTKCPVKPNITAQAFANAETQKETIRQTQEKLLSNNSGEEDIFSCEETGLGVLICPFKIIARIWGKFTTLLQTLGNFLYGVSSIASPPGVGNVVGWILPEKAYADGMIDLPTIWHSSTGSTGDMLNDTIRNASVGVSSGSGGVHSIYTYIQYFVVVLFLFIVIVLVVLALTI